MLGRCHCSRRQPFNTVQGRSGTHSLGCSRSSRRRIAAAQGSGDSQAGADSAAPSSSAPSDDGGNSAERGGDPGTPTPWEIMLYITKKRERRTNALGEIVVGADTLAEPMNWSGDAQLGLATKIVAREMGVAEAEVEQNLQQLRRLLPDMDASPLKPAQLVRLALDLDGVAQRLLVLRTAFPTANVSSIACRHPQLLLDADVQRLRDSAEEVKQLLGGNSKAADALLESCPSLADASNLKAVLAEASRLFGAADGTAAARLLLNSPELADMCQSLKHQSRGERDTDYLRDIYTAGGDD